MKPSFKGWPGPGGAAVTRRDRDNRGLYRVLLDSVWFSNGSCASAGPPEHLGRSALQVGPAQLRHRAAQIVEQRLDRRVLAVDQGERRLAPRLGLDALPQGRPGLAAVLCDLPVEEAKRLPVPAWQGAEEGVVGGAEVVPPRAF